jgi:hypothetical protein
MNPGTRAVLFGAQRLRPYLGQVASHSFLASLFGTTNKQSMTRTRHVCLNAVTSVQLMFPSWQGQEVATGANATITASVEYPIGTFNQVLFSGSSSGTITDGSFILSDPVSVSLPLGAVFFVRSYYTNTAGCPFHNHCVYPTLGEASKFAASGVADQTMSGTITHGGGEIGYGPIAIIGQTTTASVLIIGDSRAMGFVDTIGPTDSSVGNIARSFGDAYPYSNMGISGGQATLLASKGSSSTLAQMGSYFTHVICEFGTNDFVAAGKTAAQIIVSLGTIKGYYPGKPFYQCTIEPRTTGAWTLPDGSDQTVLASEAQRVSLNASIRAGTIGMTGYFELADRVESSRDSGKWIAPGYTTDGTHETATANIAIKTSGAINPMAFVRLRA